MREDALIAEVRAAAQLPTDSHDYSAAVIRGELNTQLQMRFARVMVAARVGMMLKTQSQTLAVGTRTYPLPSRAMSAGFECLDISDGTSYWPLQQILPHQVHQYEGMSAGRPEFYCVVGSSVRFYPSPSQAYTVRTQYYLRPSRLVEKQATTTYGLIVGANPSTNRELSVLTMASLVDRDTSSPITTSRRIDIVRGSPNTEGSLNVEHSDASYEVVAVDLSWVDTTPGFVITLGGTDDISEIRTGDYIRASRQSEWPTMPHEYHPALAWAAAAKICRDRGMYQAAQSLEGDVMRALGEMADDVQPRVKASSQPLVPRAHMLRGRWF